MVSSGDAAESAGLFLLAVCLAVSIWLGHVVHCRRISFLTEATVSLLVGLLAGGAALAYYTWWLGRPMPASLVELNTQVFFDALLPPIIFQAGFSVKKKSFFRNFTTLFCLGVLGTFLTAGLLALGCRWVLSTLGVGAHLVTDSLALGTVMSSSDSVAALSVLDQDAQPVLFSLVFGEGVVNDATSLVLLSAVQKMSRSSQLDVDTMLAIALNFARLFVLSLMLGVGVGLASAALIKRSFVHHSTDREVALVGLLGFLAYLLAEQLGLSGVFAIFFCGITMSHYTWHALSPSAKVVTVYLFRILSFAAELFLFLYAGVSMWSTTLWQSDLFSKAKLMRTSGLLALALVLQVLLARAVAIIPLVALSNAWRPPNCRLTLRQAAVIWWGGSMRGAITVAMALKTFGRAGAQESVDNQIIVVASSAAVVISTVVMGACTNGLVGWLLAAPDDQLSTLGTLTSHASLDVGGARVPLLAAALQRSLHWSHRSHIYRAWHWLDGRFLRPMFGGRPPRPDDYHSPPPSPGRQVIQQVMGPGILKRMAPRAPGAAPKQQQLGRGASGRVDPFCLRPAPSEPAVDAGAAAGGGAGGASRLASRAPTTVGGASLLSLHPEAVDMHASDGLEELFNRNSARLDSQVSQEIQYGEAAVLAAGAPSWDGGSQLLADAAADAEAAEEAEEQRAAGQPHQGPPNLHRPSPFQSEGRNGAGTQ